MLRIQDNCHADSPCIDPRWLHDLRADGWATYHSLYAADQGQILSPRLLAQALRKYLLSLPLIRMRLSPIWAVQESRGMSYNGRAKNLMKLNADRPTSDLTNR
jgi:hypothetical protein